MFFVCTTFLFSQKRRGESNRYVMNTYEAVWTLVGPYSIINSGQIASTEKYAFDIEVLSVFGYTTLLFSQK